jgi:hypothetical protein
LRLKESRCLQVNGIKIPPLRRSLVLTFIGSICGSVFVNLAFKKWLRQLLGADIYKELDQTQLASKIHSRDAEGERMRALMKRFDIQKLKFRKGQRDIKIDLPEPFENLDIENKVIGGQITIT